MFNVGDHVVYGNVGVCRVENVGPLAIGMEGKDYYTLVPVYEKKSTLYTAVDSEKVVIRPVMTKKETDELLDEMIELDTLWITDEKKREEVYKEAMRTCDCKEWVKMIKTLYMRKQERIAKGKKATSSDERYLHLAEENLYGELAFSLQIPKEKVGDFLMERVWGRKAVSV